MLEYQFDTMAENGFIRIPDEYIKKIGSKIKVTVVNDDELDVDWDKLFPSVMKTSFNISSDVMFWEDFDKLAQESEDEELKIEDFPRADFGREVFIFKGDV